MSIMASIVAAACVNMPSADSIACSKALEAGSKQIGIYEQVDKLGDHLEKESIKEIQFTLGKNLFDVVGASAFITKTVVDKAITVKLPTFGICDEFISQAGTDHYGLKIQWRF